MILQSSRTVSSFVRARRMGGAVAAGVRPPAPVSQADGLDRLWAVANSGQHTGEAKARRILAAMELAAVRPSRKRGGTGPGWWSNEYPDLIFS